MHNLVCCWLFIGLFSPLLSLPVLDSKQESLQFSAPDEDARLTLDELERAFLLEMLSEDFGAGQGNSLKKADPSINFFSPRGNKRKFQAPSGQDPNTSLNHLLARIRKQYKKNGPPSECFWKYCV
ncbi:urotensin-2 [Erinaceus europaeus]|uniref:Urotensin-2 n=1 Tax=Erinaceus europaeus TaxID=9365 RepID=A0A1S3ACY8_ERIEU|nr:urotensin-2 [Erinaceus europaeus]